MRIHRASLVLVVVGAALLPISVSLSQAPANVSFAGTKATWDGMFHIPLHCVGSATCTGRMSVSAPGSSDPIGDEAYSIPAGATKSAIIDPGGDNSKINALTQVDARLTPGDGQGDPVQATLTVVHQTVHHNTTPKLVGSVKDKRGDGVGRLDLRKVTAKVRKGRLILRFTCWKKFGAADFDHNIANFNAHVTFTSNAPPNKPPVIGVFMAHGHPFLQAGYTQFPNKRVRFSRPNNKSIQLSIPVTVFAKHPKRLYIYPSVLPYKGRKADLAPRLAVKVKR